MAKVTFDGINKLIRVNAGVENIDVGSELYSEWKRWLLSSDNSKYLQAFRSLGGDPTNPDETQFAPRYYFLMNGWRVYVDGNAIVFQINLYTDEGESPFIVVNGGAVTNRASDVPNVITELPEIQYSSFGGTVTLDATSPYSGHDFPVGTKAHPVNNADDAVFIAADRGFDSISVKGPYTFNDTDVLDDFIIIGQNANKTQLSFPPLCSCLGVEIKEAFVAGTLDGGTILRNCVIQDLDYVNGVIFNCMLNPGVIRLGGNTVAHFLDCWSGQPGTGTPTVDFNFGHNSLGVRGYNGGIKLINKNQPESVSIDLSSGQIKLDSTVTHGTIVCRGVGKITDDTLDTEPVIVLSEDLLNSHNIANATLNTDLTDFSEMGTAGESLRRVYYSDAICIDLNNGVAGQDYPVGTRNQPVNNLIDAFTLSQRFTIHTLSLAPQQTVTFTNTMSLRGVHLMAQSSGETTIVVESGCPTTSTIFDGLFIEGELDGRCTILNSMIGDLAGFDGYMDNCGFLGGTTLSFGNNMTTKSVIQNSQTVGDQDNIPTFDFSNIGISDVTIKSYIGVMNVVGKTQDQFTSIILTEGHVVVSNTCTDGELFIGGSGHVEDNNNGTLIITTHLNNDHTIADTVWSHSTAVQLSDDIELVRQIESGRWAIINDQMIFYAGDNVTEIARFDLLNEFGQPTSQNVMERKRV